MGHAYRELGRSAPIDTVSHHPYGERSRKRPWKKHLRGTTIGQGDWPLMQAYYDAFAGTPSRGEGSTQIWYLEASSDKSTPLLRPRDRYRGPGDESAAERRRLSTKAPDHVDAVRLAFCQPYVESYFNFLLFDEHSTWRARVVQRPAGRPAARTAAPDSGPELATSADVLTRHGTIRRGWFSWVKLPRTRLPAGKYRIEVEVASSQNPARTVTVLGPEFSVKARPVRQPRKR